MTRRNINAHRYPCGRVVQLTPAQREDDVMSVALAQPHRRGSREQLRVDAIGRLVQKFKLRHEILQAVDRYKIVRQDWLKAFDMPPMERLEMFEDGPKRASGLGLGPTWREVQRWRRKLDKWEKAAIAGDSLGWIWLRFLILEGQDIPENYEPRAVRALLALAVATGKLTSKDHPFI